MRRQLVLEPNTHLVQCDRQLLQARVRLLFQCFQLRDARLQLLSRGRPCPQPLLGNRGIQALLVQLRTRLVQLLL